MGGDQEQSDVELTTLEGRASIAVLSRRANGQGPSVATAWLETRAEAGSLHLKDVVRTEDGIGSETQRHLTRENKYLGD
jgi:hypothetical protein